MTLILPIPSMRPLLVNHQNMIKYLQRIDDARYYSNFGPLVREYEGRLSKLFNSNVVSTASCTSALTCALLALGLPRGSKCLVQSWTFCGSVAAIVAAGLEPVFADVHEDLWQLSVEDAKYRCWHYPEIKVVMPVSQFGLPISLSSWADFRDETDIPVVVDAAGCFDFIVGYSERSIPVCISTHATKTFSTGEGGMVVCEEHEFIDKVKKITNYGYDIDRTIPLPGFNAKMSEYHAAVGLAELDWWDEKSGMWIDVQGKYETKFKKYVKAFPDVRSLFPILVHPRSADEAIEGLASHGITARKIWGDGCHTHEAYKHYHRFDLTNTKRLANEVITLPFAIDMTDEEIEYIHEKFTEVVG